MDGTKAERDEKAGFLSRGGRSKTPHKAVAAAGMSASAPCPHPLEGEGEKTDSEKEETFSGNKQGGGTQMRIPALERRM